MLIQPQTESSSFPCHFCLAKTQKQASIQKAPAFLGCTKAPKEQDQFLSFSLYSCPACGLIQTDAQALETTYKEIHSEALGPTWEEHHRSFAAFVQQAIHPSVHSVLELGASSQPIARKLSGLSKIYYIDPIHTPPFSLQEKERYFSGFFPEVAPPEKVDLILASHVLEHIPRTHLFFEKIRQFLNPGGSFLISIPQFETWFRKSYFNAISAEHVSYAFPAQLQKLAELHGCSVHFSLHKEHSLFAAFQWKKPSASHPFSFSSPKESQTLLSQWMTAFQKAMHPPIQSSDTGSLFLAGASHLAQYFLLNNASLAPRIQGVLDNSSRKWGQRLYGTAVNACSFEVLRNEKHPTVYLPPSPYEKEMEAQIFQINPHAQIIPLVATAR